MEIGDFKVLDAIGFTKGIDSCNYCRGCGNDSDIRSGNDLTIGDMITFIPTLFVVDGMEEKTIQFMHVDSVGKGWFIVSENTAEKRHGTVLLVIKLYMM